MVSNLDRLYVELTTKVGFTRIRDVRLERIAMDRALEMRYQQGLTYSSGNPIEHQPYQLRARVYPWQDADGTTENATWHYFPPTWVDAITAAIDYTFPNDPATYGDYAGQSVGWWNSTIHKSQLLDTRWTHWGMGIHFEDTSLGSRRWYFITVFAAPMDGLEVKNITVPIGKLTGYDLTAEGDIIAKHYTTLIQDVPATIDDRANVPTFGPMVHMASRPLKNTWVKENRIAW